MWSHQTWAEPPPVGELPLRPPRTGPPERNPEATVQDLRPPRSLDMAQGWGAPRAAPRSNRGAQWLTKLAQGLQRSVRVSDSTGIQSCRTGQGPACLQGRLWVPLGHQCPSRGIGGSGKARPGVCTQGRVGSEVQCPSAPRDHAAEGGGGAADPGPGTPPQEAAGTPSGSRGSGPRRLLSPSGGLPEGWTRRSHLEERRKQREHKGPRPHALCGRNHVPRPGRGPPCSVTCAGLRERHGPVPAPCSYGRHRTQAARGPRPGHGGPVCTGRGPRDLRGG